MPVVESNRVGAQQPPHSRDKVGLGCLDHQVEVIAHQAIGMHLEPRFLARLRQGLEEILPVNVILEGVLPAIPSQVP